MLHAVLFRHASIAVSSTSLASRVASEPPEGVERHPREQGGTGPQRNVSSRQTVRTTAVEAPPAFRHAAL
jgi:hypothetical protein